jgi:hypothetical protein
VWSVGTCANCSKPARCTSELSSWSKYGPVRLADSTDMKQVSVRERTEVVMDADYMMACGIVWRKTADPDAGRELVEALASPDPELR